MTFSAIFETSEDAKEVINALKVFYPNQKFVIEKRQKKLFENGEYVRNGEIEYYAQTTIVCFGGTNIPIGINSSNCEYV